MQNKFWSNYLSANYKSALYVYYDGNIVVPKKYYTYQKSHKPAIFKICQLRFCLLFLILYLYVWNIKG